MKIFVQTITILVLVSRCVAAPAAEPDLLKLVEKNPLGITVDGKSVKYGDPNLTQAVERLSDIPHPWTIPDFIRRFDSESNEWLRKVRKLVAEKKTEMWAASDAESRHIAALARVLAASRDPCAAVALGRILKIEDFPFWARTDAYDGLFDYFVKDYDYGLPEEKKHKLFAGNLVMVTHPAVDRWWADNQKQLETQAAKLNGTNAILPKP